MPPRPAGLNAAPATAPVVFYRARRPWFPTGCLAAAVGIGLAACAPNQPAASPGGFDRQKFMGTWQIMTVKNLKTGEIDSIANRRVAWTQYTKTHWTYVYSDTGRVGHKPAETAALSKDARWKENYAKMWDQNGQYRFWGSGGNYWLEGNRMYYTNLVSIEPYMIQLGGIENIIYVNDTAYAYQSVPDKEGVVREYTHRRLDWADSRSGGPAASASTASSTARPPDRQAALIIGNWQVMSQRNLKTGAEQNVAQKRINWFHVTGSHWTYVWMTKDRKNVTPDELAATPEPARAKERYAKIWDPQDKAVFWASGGMYHIENGKFVVEGRVMSIEPWMVGVEGVEPIMKLDSTAYVYQSPPSDDGTISETTHRRVDW